MRAALFERRGGPLELGALVKPKPEADDVLIEVKAAGVCYTDLRLIDGSDRGDGGPIVPGHEVVGRVSEVGTNVAAFVAGDRVAVHAHFSCGECEPCRMGEEEACARGISRLAGFGVNGGYAAFIVAPASHVVSLPDELRACRAVLLRWPHRLRRPPQRGHQTRAAGSDRRHRRARKAISRSRSRSRWGRRCTP